MKESIVKEKSFEFALQIIELYQVLQEEKRSLSYQNNSYVVEQV